MTTTSGFSAFALEPFPEVHPGDDLSGAISDVLARTGTELRDGDVVVVASKVVSIAEKRYVDLDGVTVSPQALDLAAHGEPVGTGTLRWHRHERLGRFTVRGDVPAGVATTRRGRRSTGGEHTAWGVRRGQV
ncbi:coenzyme F420-0:L-glutamate ligase [Streptomyces sp. NPDC048106]|uniref:coenzyme F420-0:L-glutamate ligase n=1 Tax=Streptomyces sp. NPDC048106 TaxID=3155750 RepID=UPI0034559EB7